MGWKSELKEELHKAELDKKRLLRLMSLTMMGFRVSTQKLQSKVAKLTQKLESQETKCNDEIEALEAEKCKALSKVERIRIQLSAFESDYFNNVKSINRRICFTKELQKLQNCMDLRKFPVEIFQYILQLLLVQDDSIRVSNDWKTLHLNVFYTSKMIKDEAYAIFYGSNTFFITKNNSFLLNFSAYLKHVELEVDECSNGLTISDCLRQVELCKQLQSLVISVSYASVRQYSRCLSMLYSIKFKRPQTLGSIKLQLAATCAAKRKEKEAADILQVVLDKGFYERRDEDCSISSKAKRRRLL